MIKPAALFQKIFNPLILYLLLLTVNLLFWGNALSHFVINADDAYVLLDAPEYFQNFGEKLIDVTDRYRPVGRVLFNVYLPFQYNAQQAYLLHVGFFTLVQFLFFLVAQKSLSANKAFALAIFIFSNPIFYYHVFAIASDMNLEIMAILLLTVLAIQRKKYLLTLPLFFAAIFIKETFVVLAPLVGYALWHSKLSRKNQLAWVGGIGLVMLAYVGLRFGSYAGEDPNYQFAFNLATAKQNLGDMAAWLANHPRGPQFAFAGFRSEGNYIVVAVLAVLWSLAVYFSAKQKLWLAALLATLGFSLAPFVFLTRVLVFYMDIPFIVFGLLLIPVLQQKKLVKFVVSLMVIVVILTLQLFLSKWLQEGFVGNANMVAKNFMRVVRPTAINQNLPLCIINHKNGIWPSAIGRLVYFMDQNYQQPVTSLESNDLTLCPPGVIIENVGDDYRVISGN